jgi:hypothetical protein
MTCGTPILSIVSLCALALRDGFQAHVDSRQGFMIRVTATMVHHTYDLASPENSERVRLKPVDDSQPFSHSPIGQRIFPPFSQLDQYLHVVPCLQQDLDSAKHVIRILFIHEPVRAEDDQYRTSVPIEPLRQVWVNLVNRRRGL